MYISEADRRERVNCKDTPHKRKKEKVKELVWKDGGVDTGEEEEIDEGAKTNVGEDG